MILASRPAKILLIDTNVYFSKRLSDALKREGFEVNCSTQPSFALTTIEYDPPSAIVCSTNMREMGALDIARLIRADAKNSTLPVIALGDGSQRALMEAFQAGCDDYIDRSRPPAVIASHVRNIVISKAEGFQPTQMLPQADTSLTGSLSHHDLPAVMQMLGHAHQTGALHINSGDTDALLFFDAGAVAHAECGSLFGDEAVIHILKSCMKNNSGIYKFVYGSSSARHTVLRSATDLMLDAMREIDESAREPEQAGDLAVDGASEDAAPTARRSDSPFSSLLGLTDSPASDESAAIATALDNFAANSGATNFSSSSEPVQLDPPLAGTESTIHPQEDIAESENALETPAASEPPSEPKPQEFSEASAAEHVEPNSNSPAAEPSFANYSIVPYAGNDIEDIP